MRAPQSPLKLFRLIRVMTRVELESINLSAEQLIDLLEDQLLDEVVYKHNYAPTGLIETSMEKYPLTCEVTLLSEVIGEPSTQAEGAD